MNQTQNTSNSNLIEIKDLKVHFIMDEGTVEAVNGVSFNVCAGKTLGVVGESGCGKSVTSQAIMRIVPQPGKIVSGQINLHRPLPDGNSESVDLAKMDRDGKDIRAIRGKEISMIFQEPMTSFSPLYTIGNQIMEAVRLHQKMDHKEARDYTIDLLDKVGIPKPSRRIDEFPFELFGRPATAGDDRNGAIVPAALVDRRRTDDCAGRDCTSANP